MNVARFALQALSFIKVTTQQVAAHPRPFKLTRRSSYMMPELRGSPFTLTAEHRQWRAEFQSMSAA